VGGGNRQAHLYPKDFVINYMAKSAERSPWTHVFELYPYEIEDRIRSDLYKSFDYRSAPSGNDEETRPDKLEATQCFGEQHTRLDLDQDGYPEPYIVTFHIKTQKVVRIERRFKADNVIKEGGNPPPAARPHSHA
jgi:hypothetical protein